MSQKIIFFDIDRTLFDADRLLYDFYEKLNNDFGLNDVSIDEIKIMYSEVKAEFGYFSPKVFIDKIDNTFPHLKGKLNFVFEEKNLENYLFSDTSVLPDLSNITLGILSKGDSEYQKAKIVKFKDIIDKDRVFVFSNKMDNLEDVFSKYKNYQIYIVDDEEAVLTASKLINSSVVTFLIDRKKKIKESDKIDFVIESLFDIIPILNEKNT